MTMVTTHEQNLDPRYIEARSAVGVLESAGFKTMFAGGCVRDRLLGIAPKDYDLATVALPLAVQKLFTSLGYKIIPTGIDHGTVSLIGSTGQFEVTTLRRDVATDGRRAVVAFADSFKEDAERRDFTINAMYEDLAGNVHDFFNGLTDLKNRRLAFVGDPRLRIQEDYLRILRFFRFWARLEFLPDETALAAIGEFSDGLRRISQERITSEVLQIFGSQNPASVLAAMKSTGVLAVVLPESSSASIEVVPLGSISGSEASTPEERAVVRLAAFLSPLSSEKMYAVGKRLRLSTSDNHKLRCFSESLVWLQQASNSPTEAACMRFVDFIEASASRGSFERIFSQALNIFLANKSGFSPYIPVMDRVNHIEKTMGEKRRLPMPVNGEHLMSALKIHAGPQIKALLEDLKDRFRMGEWSTSAQGIQLASQIILAKKPFV